MFTTHTPVPAGHDAFPFNLVETHLAGAWGTLGAYRDAFLALGHYDNGSGPLFNMTALALRTAGAVNAVSQLHGAGHARDVGADLAGRAGRPAAGARHHQRRPRADLAVVRDGAAVRRSPRRPTGASATTIPTLWTRVLEIPDEELWARAQRAAQLPVRVHPRARAPALEGRARQRRRASSPPARCSIPNALTHRLRAALHRLQAARADLPQPRAAARHPQRRAAARCRSSSPARRIPADETGKHHLQQVYRRAIDPMFGGRIAFVDDYDLHVAHFLVQGCDVWLNNPRKPLEASGTSGMKASINGVPHLSIGDGWWAEGYTGENGWLIEGQAPPHDPDAVDAADAEALYQLLETRDRAGVLRSRHARDPAALAVGRPAGDHHGHAALQRAPDGQGVRRRRCTARRCGRAAPTSDRRWRSTDRSDVPENHGRRRAARCAAPRRSPSRAARSATAATAGTRRSPSRRSSRASSRSSATSARTAPRNTSSTTRR